MGTSSQQKVPASLAGELPPGGSYSPGCRFFFFFICHFYLVFIFILTQTEMTFFSTKKAEITKYK
jgi:hypothetical protein